MVQIRRSFQELLAEAEEQVEALDASEAERQIAAGDLVPVDLRDVRELQREGKIPGALHVPRGMLEFWVDPESPYHRADLTSAPRVLLYCASGWRSALAAKTLLDMGATEGVYHLAGGFTAWQEDERSVERVDRR